MSLDLDQRIAELPELQPPAELRDRVLAEVKQEMLQPAALASSSRSRRAWLYPGLAMAAAALLFVSLPGPEVQDLNLVSASPESRVVSTAVPRADPADLVPKGAGAVTPAVQLKMSVRSGDTVSRLVEGAAYPSGAELYFRASVGAAAELTLIRVNADAIERVHQQSVSAGDTDLSLADGVPLAWRIEDGETSAIYALLAEAQAEGGLHRAATSWELVVSRLDGAYDLDHADVLCSALQGLDLRCFTQVVRVNP
jgi:hypothetical protein